MIKAFKYTFSQKYLWPIQHNVLALPGTFLVYTQEYLQQYHHLGHLANHMIQFYLVKLFEHDPLGQVFLKLNILRKEKKIVYE